MNKLKSAVLYECSTTFKAICIFYAIQYIVISVISLIIVIASGSFENVGISGLEINSVIFAGIFGVLGFKEDFKMLIQNGFTRKYIFLSTLCMFIFMSAVMALIDTITGQALHLLSENYFGIFGFYYGYENIFANWIWLACVYILVLSLLYLTILIINRLGKMLSIYLGIAFFGIILIVIALFNYVFSVETVNNIFDFLTKAMGFMADGSINYIFPVLTFLSIAAILEIGAYLVIRRAQVR